MIVSSPCEFPPQAGVHVKLTPNFHASLDFVIIFKNPCIIRLERTIKMAISTKIETTRYKLCSTILLLAAGLLACRLLPIPRLDATPVPQLQPTHTFGAIPKTAINPTATLLPEPSYKQEGVYYLSSQGNDSNPGTLDAPWQTIQKAADTLTAGESVYIRAGRYPEHVILQHSGETGREITYAAYPGEEAIIDGENIDLPDDLVGLVDISDLSYIHLVGLHVVNVGPNANNAGILVNRSSHVIIENITTINTASSGIGIWQSDHILIEGNYVEAGGSGGGQECITMAGSSDFLVTNNVVKDCQKEGIDAKDGSTNGQIIQNIVENPRVVGIYVDAWDKATHDILVTQNTVFGSRESAGFTVASEQGGYLFNIRLENNIAYENYTYGIEISRCCTESHPMDSITLINNTVYNNGEGWGGGIIIDNAQVQNMVVRNNIASQNLTFQIARAVDVPVENVTIDHNLIDGFRGYEDEVYGGEFIEADPGFFDPSVGDFHLMPDSPAIDAGSELDAPGLDFDGDLRLQDGDRDGAPQVDIGADEFAIR
jgi:hypothetical protein